VFVSGSACSLVYYLWVMLELQYIPDTFDVQNHELQTNFFYKIGARWRSKKVPSHRFAACSVPIGYEEMDLTLSI
jgi:hypothetical protein